MFCPKCGNQLPDGGAFCGKCGAPIGAVQQVASSSKVAQADNLPAPKKGVAKIAIIAPVVIVAVVLVAGFATNWFGLTSVQPEEAVDLPAASSQPIEIDQPEDSSSDVNALEVQDEIQGDDRESSATPADVAIASAKSSVEDYTWIELSRISEEIAAAGDEDAAIEVAKKYNLCTPDGKLDGTQTKSMTLLDGTQVAVQIAGFAHDDKTDGGKAGITFIFYDCLTDYPMNLEASNEGGWEDSFMRAYLNGLYRRELNSSVLELLPEELANVIVPVDKLTNNVGQTSKVESVSVTSDMLWLFSVKELCGDGDWLDSTYDDLGNLDAVLNAEGSEYKLFRDMGVDSTGPNNSLIKDLDGSPFRWWTRSSNPWPFGFFIEVNYDGDPNYMDYANESRGVVPGFCI